MDTEAITVSLPQRKVGDLVEAWPPGRKTAALREVLTLAGKLHCAVDVIRPGWYFVRRLL